MNMLRLAWEWLTDAANWSGGNGIPARTLTHLRISAIVLLLASAIAIPLGLLSGHTNRGGFLVINSANAARALPTVGLLYIIALAFVTVSSIPAIVALTALAIPPILVNTYEGIRTVDPGLKDAATGMGLTGWRVLSRVEMPVASPLILLGVRTAAIQVVATATIAAYVGLETLGTFIQIGDRTRDQGQLYGGAFLVIALALAVAALFVVLHRTLVPIGVRQRSTIR